MGQIRTSVRLWNLKKYPRDGDEAMGATGGINTFVRGPRPNIGSYKPLAVYKGNVPSPAKPAERRPEAAREL